MPWILVGSFSLFASSLYKLSLSTSAVCSSGHTSRLQHCITSQGVASWPAWEIVAWRCFCLEGWSNMDWRMASFLQVEPFGWKWLLHLWICTGKWPPWRYHCSSHSPGHNPRYHPGSIKAERKETEQVKAFLNLAIIFILSSPCSYLLGVCFYIQLCLYWDTITEFSTSVSLQFCLVCLPWTTSWSWRLLRLLRRAWFTM